jgi:hypothetical protein
VVRIQGLHDAALEILQHAVAGNATFGEDGQQITVRW